MRAARRSLLVASLLAVGCATMPSPQSCPPSGLAQWPAGLDHPSTPDTRRAAVDELFTVMHLAETFQQGLEQAVRTQLDAQPSLRPMEGVMRAFFARYMSFDAMRDGFARIYLDAFTELEVRQMTAFYRTPVGRRAVQEVPDLMRRGGQIGTEQVRAHQSELLEMVRAEMERRGEPQPH